MKANKPLMKTVTVITTTTKTRQGIYENVNKNVNKSMMTVINANGKKWVQKNSECERDRERGKVIKRERKCKN